MCFRLDVKVRKCIDCGIIFLIEFNMFRYVCNIYKFFNILVLKNFNFIVLFCL